MEKRSEWLDPVIPADKAAIFDLSSNSFLWRKNADVKQPLASITKLMTALVFLDNNPGWDKVYKIGPEDNISGGKVNLFLGEELSAKDLFYASLVASDNGATIAMVHLSGLSEEAFVLKMNEKARQLGLFNTSFADPIGLSDRNLSTASDIARLAKAAFADADIAAATTKDAYIFKTQDGKKKTLESTDYLLGLDLGGEISVSGGKTGYTDKAGYCFVGRFKNQSGREIIVVVLNSDTKNNRFKDSKALALWSFAGYSWGK